MPQAATLKLADAVLDGQRRALGRAITLVESNKVDDRANAYELLELLRQRTAGQPLAVRVGITGVPGAGKSTFINALGIALIEQGHKVSVLAVDPSSSKTGGSILGDRTRMGVLAQSDQAFIRPSPSGTHLGGVARATREAMLLVEAAGYDVVLVETVGVGQSEVAVASMVDTFLLLTLARTGDQLQGIKKGILEMADVIAVNKADGDNEATSQVAARELRTAMHLVGQVTPPQVLTLSAQTGSGLMDVWQAVLKHRARLGSCDGLNKRRANQQRDWLWALIDDTLLQAMRQSTSVVQRRAAVEQAVEDGQISAIDGAEQLLKLLAADVPTRWLV
ncbi:MAG: methylmalonyl Co-A mutase-associated GTPase MeaB [Propionibacteriaceae bacterium]|nr:methylmalonyl Co-A mutase-associated GTPase MeaB [Propionibacteriaceae bacterium]